MKKTILIISAILISLTTFSQTLDNESKKPLERIIFDIGVTPYQFNFSDAKTSKSLNFALGYEITKRIDLRFNVDLNAFTSNYYISEADDLYQYKHLTGCSFGVNYMLFDDFKFIYDHSSIDILGKFGIDLEGNVQQSLFYDISARLKMKDLSYIGIGYNHHILDIGFQDAKGFYFTFGIEF